jgi:hypothetical protein
MHGICVCNLQSCGGVIGNPSIYGIQIDTTTAAMASRRLTNVGYRTKNSHQPD